MEITNNKPTPPVESESGEKSETEKLKNTDATDFMSLLLGLPTDSQIKTPTIDAEAVDTVEVEIPSEDFNSSDLNSSLRLKEATSSSVNAKLEVNPQKGNISLEPETFAELMEASEKDVSDVDVEKGIQKYLESAAAALDTSKDGVEAPSSFKETSQWMGVASGSPTASDYTEVTRVTEKPAVADTSLQQMFEGVQTLASRGGGKMTVSLNPAHLGQMEIEVNAKGNRVSVEMVSESHAAKAMIESQLADLKTAMQGQDLILSRVQVQVGNEGHWASDRGERGFSQSQRESGTLVQARTGDRLSAAPITSGPSTVRLSSNRLDLRI